MQLRPTIILTSLSNGKVEAEGDGSDSHCTLTITSLACDLPSRHRSQLTSPRYLLMESAERHSLEPGATSNTRSRYAACKTRHQVKQHLGECLGILALASPRLARTGIARAGPQQALRRALRIRIVINTIIGQYLQRRRAGNGPAVAKGASVRVAVVVVVSHRMLKDSSRQEVFHEVANRF